MEEDSRSPSFCPESPSVSEDSIEPCPSLSPEYPSVNPESTEPNNESKAMDEPEPLYAPPRSPDIDDHLASRGRIDRYRALWEVRWGLVKEFRLGDWVLVKWVTNKDPVFPVADILFMARSILFNRRAEYPPTNDAEQLLMWILRDIVWKYETHDRVLYTLIHYNVDRRFHNIQSESDKLDGEA